MNRHQNNYQNALDYYEKSISHYLLYKSKTVEELHFGMVKDETLGDMYWNVSFIYSKRNLEDKSVQNICSAAMCGHELAIETLVSIYKLDRKKVLEIIYK